MSDYISRDAVKKSLIDSYDKLKVIYDGLLFGYEREICAAQLIVFFECILRIKEFPAADVVPVVHGRWVNYSEKHALSEECSVCGGGVMWDMDGSKHHYNYCPNCGAKMDAEVEE